MIHDEPLSLFTGDGLHRLLVRLRLEDAARPDLWRRTVYGILVTWLPLFVLAGLSNNLFSVVPDVEAGIGNPPPFAPGGLLPRESFMMDLASMAQFLGFFPLAFFAEGFIGVKVQTAFYRLRPVVDDGELRVAARRAAAWARSSWADVVIIPLAYAATWSWWSQEITNGLDSWHTAVESHAPIREHFTLAGYWVAWIALPLFTYLWMRWVWKIGAWTYFLLRVSRMRLTLQAAHPDRTGGLGCLSDVQTSFAVILFGTGLLFSAWAIHKLYFERTPFGSIDVWGPIVVYVVLAPLVFVAPLFLFTGVLARAKRDALVAYGEMSAALTSHFERRWMRGPERAPGEVLDSSQSSALTDFNAAYQIVEDMRVVPFDRRSFLELFSASATPFAPVAFFLELPSKIQNVLGLIS